MAQTTTMQSGQIIEIYNSRKTIIDLLEAQKYDVSQYKDFGINEVNTLIQTKQMDMLLKIFVEFHNQNL